MRPTLSDEELTGISIGSLLVIGIAGILGALRGEISQANSALVLVLVVLVAAATGGHRAGIATGVMAAIAFDFFLTQPYQSLAIKSADDVITTLLLVVIGATVGVIATTRREAKAEGHDGHEEIQSLYRIATATAAGADPSEIVSATETEVAAVLHLVDCRYDEAMPDTPLPELQPSGRIDAPYVFAHDGFTLPAEGVAIAVRGGGHTYGWLHGRPSDPARGISGDRRRSALVLADHLGLVLATTHAGSTRRPLPPAATS
jgi:hypothetical protein